jgi:hypothetical protein
VPSTDSTADPDDDYVVVGGVRLPRRVQIDATLDQNWQVVGEPTLTPMTNPARDARRRVRAERERRRAARALDRYMEIYEQAVAGAGGTLPILTAGERFVEAVGDYVLSELHHNGDYGVPAADACDGHCSGNWTDPECSFHGRPKSTIKPNYGVRAETTDWAEEARNPCAGGRCSDPAAHAEGAHDV